MDEHRLYLVIGMSKVYISSDFHLGHKNIAKYRSVFKSAADHDAYIFNLLSKLTKHDKLIVLGDFLFHGDHMDDYLNKLSKVPAHIELVLGNHDCLTLPYRLPANMSMRLPLSMYKSFWLSHCPIHPHELRDRLGCIHGHLHNETLNDPHYFNANLDVNDYQLVDFAVIKSYFKDLTNE